MLHACSYRGSGETLKREEFEARREAAEQASAAPSFQCAGARAWVLPDVP
jgi:hypothetical protein